MQKVFLPSTQQGLENLPLNILTKIYKILQIFQWKINKE